MTSRATRATALVSDVRQARDVVNQLLGYLDQCAGSDLFLTAGEPPRFKIQGQVRPAKDIPELTFDDMTFFLDAIMADRVRVEFDSTYEANFGYRLPSSATRFRVNAYRQRQAPALVFRRVNPIIYTLADLGLPPVLGELALRKRGLVLFVGGTGTGKTTSLAALIDHRNRHTSGHILTIEDPIEFEHRSRECLVTQREVGVDTLNWDEALKNALRQAPDVILMGEIRDACGMEHCLAYADTGHLVLATLHANNATQALERIVNFFDHAKHEQIRRDLSANMQAIISQRLVRRIDSTTSRVAAIEILINSPAIADSILKADIARVKELVRRSSSQGMQTFDQHLLALYAEKVISREEVLAQADSRGEVTARMKATERVDDAALAHLHLQDI